MNIKNQWVADFETLKLTEEEIEEGKSTYVWLWGACNCEDAEGTFIHGSTIDEFFQFLSTLKNRTVLWFHNLKFDSQFILAHLLKYGWVQKDSTKDLKSCEFCTSCNTNGVFYSLTLNILGKTIQIFDSYKKLPFKVEKIAKDLGFEQQKGSIDYSAFREEGHEADEIEIEYVKNDVVIIAKALKEVFFDRGLFKQTIGGDCLYDYKSTQSRFFDLFPVLDSNVYNDLIPAYKGGWVNINKKIANKLLKNINGISFDYNSQYPSVMRLFPFPYGQPVKFEGGYEEDVQYDLYIQKFKCCCKLKKNKVPTVQVSCFGMYRDTEYLEEAIDEQVELTLSNIDLELFFDHYEVWNIELLGGYKFKSSKGMFNKYIDKWYEMKEQASITGNKTERLVAKLFLNNLGGKFGQKDIASNQIFRLEDGKVKSDPKIGKKDTLYLPVAIFMTAYARRELMKVIDDNYSIWLYSDTDSAYFSDIPIIENIHETKLGNWKQEKQFNEAIFVRPKTYIVKVNNEWNITGCGMNDEVKENILKEIEKKGPEIFKIGAEFTGKLITTKVKGGVVLSESTFKIRK